MLWKFISGLCIIIISIVVFVLIVSNPSLTILLMIILLGIAILIVGIARIIISLVTKEYEKWYRVLILLVGILSVIFAAIIFLVPAVGYLVQVIIISISLFSNGLARLILGIIGTE